MPPFFRPIPSLLFLALCAYVIWVWARLLWPRRGTTPKWRAITTIAGLLLATFSTILSVFLFVHATFTGGYPFYHSVELFCIRFGFFAAALGLVASIAGKGNVRLHVAIMSGINVLLWIMDAVAQ